MTAQNLYCNTFNDSAEAIDLLKQKLNQADPYFLFDATKIQFDKYIKAFYDTKPSRKFWSREAVVYHIIVLKDAINRHNAGTALTAQQTRMTKKYYVSQKNNVDVVCFRRNVSYGDVPIIPGEESFYIIAEVHINTEHGNRQSMLNMLRGKFYVPRFCLDYFLSACNICSAASVGSSPTLKFNSTTQVDILDMSSCADNELSYVLVYVDKFTKFVILRPLRTIKLPEIAIELLKMFLDIGAPTVMECHDSVFLELKATLQQAWPNTGDIEIVETAVPFAITLEQVNDKLQSWMSKKNSAHWSLGCHMTQWAMNITDDEGAIPYNLVFGSTAANGMIKNSENESAHITVPTPQKMDVDCPIRSDTPEDEILSFSDDSTTLATDADPYLGSDLTAVDAICHECCAPIPATIHQYRCGKCRKKVHSVCCEKKNTVIRKMNVTRIKCYSCRNNEKAVKNSA